MKKRVNLIVASTLVTLLSVCTTAAAKDGLTAVAQAVEKSLGARVGVAVIDTTDGKTWNYKSKERFPMASTSKALACGALLSASNTIKAQTVPIAKEDLVAYSPVTEKLIGKQVAALDLCEAALRTSDNTAANKVLEVLGGPSKVTEFLRHNGDKVTRLDRREPELNEGRPGDNRDTTTPVAIATTLRNLVLGSVLSDPERDQLTRWLVSNEVGGPLLRAGVPRDWKLADRTGAGGFGTRGVVAVMWPPNQKPLVVAVYITQTKASMDDLNKAIARIGGAISAEIAEHRH